MLQYCDRGSLADAIQARRFQRSRTGRPHLRAALLCLRVRCSLGAHICMQLHTGTVLAGLFLRLGPASLTASEPAATVSVPCSLNATEVYFECRTARVECATCTAAASCTATSKQARRRAEGLPCQLLPRHDSWRHAVPAWGTCCMHCRLTTSPGRPSAHLALLLLQAALL